MLAALQLTDWGAFECKNLAIRVKVPLGSIQVLLDQNRVVDPSSHETNLVKLAGPTKLPSYSQIGAQNFSSTRTFWKFTSLPRVLRLLQPHADHFEAAPFQDSIITVQTRTLANKIDADTTSVAQIKCQAQKQHGQHGQNQKEKIPHSPCSWCGGTRKAEASGTIAQLARAYTIILAFGMGPALAGRSLCVLIRMNIALFKPAVMEWSLSCCVLNW